MSVYTLHCPLTNKGLRRFENVWSSSFTSSPMKEAEVQFVEPYCDFASVIISVAVSKLGYTAALQS